jgi:hypothetical protein
MNATSTIDLLFVLFCEKLYVTVLYNMKATKLADKQQNDKSET